MTLIQIVTILVCLAAGFSYLNHRFMNLPLTIGMMAFALTISLVLLALGKWAMPSSCRRKRSCEESTSTRRSCAACSACFCSRERCTLISRSCWRRSGS